MPYKLEIVNFSAEIKNFTFFRAFGLHNNGDKNVGSFLISPHGDFVYLPEQQMSLSLFLFFLLSLCSQEMRDRFASHPIGALQLIILGLISCGATFAFAVRLFLSVPQ